MMNRWLILIAAVAACAAGACTTAESSSDAAGNPPRPDAGAVACDQPLSSCSLGLFHASCGGDAPPVLACSNLGHCRWYSGGCPTGFHASDCPPSNVCCHSTPGGAWPFDGWAASTPMRTTVLINQLGAMGAGIVDRASPSELSVSVDPSIAAPPSPRVTCGAGAGLQICEGGAAWVLVASVYATDESWVARFSDRGFLGEVVILEVVTDGVSVASARLFLLNQTDAAFTAPPTNCPPFQQVATSGTLRLNSLDLSTPGAIHGVLNALLVDGRSMQIDF